MMLLEVLRDTVVAVLMGYLALTNSIANYFLPEKDSQIARESQTQTVASEELTILSQLYAQAQKITPILKEHALFQELLRKAQEASVIAPTVPVTEDVVVDALVNIFCEYSTDAYTRTTTGTGFFIGEKGVILTNAHVAQFLLLEGASKEVEDAHCIVRSGNPAAPRYRAELLFISPTWILTNADLISEESPRGTGEYDYALLYVADSLTEAPLPETFPALPFSVEHLSKSLRGHEVLTAGYPAEKLLREGARAELTPKIAETTVVDMYTFGSNYADIFAISGSPVGEQGASGGPIVHPDNGAIGLIVTKGNPEDEGVNSLRALSISYIHRTIFEETGFPLQAHTEGDLAHRGHVFKEALAPFLTQLLAFEL